MHSDLARISNFFGLAELLARFDQSLYAAIFQVHYVVEGPFVYFLECFWWGSPRPKLERLLESILRNLHLRLLECFVLQRSLHLIQGGVGHLWGLRRQPRTLALLRLRQLF